jgi:hypothetical protein
MSEWPEGLVFSGLGQILVHFGLSQILGFSGLSQIVRFFLGLSQILGSFAVLLGNGLAIGQ